MTRWPGPGAGLCAIAAAGALCGSVFAGCTAAEVRAPATTSGTTRTQMHDAPQPMASSAGGQANEAPPSLARGDYPPGPYGGHRVRSVLGDLELDGHVRWSTTGLALASPRVRVRLSELRAAAPRRLALFHVSSYWCPRCRLVARDLSAKYAGYASKAIFIEVLIDGTSPEDPATAQQLDEWIGERGIPFTAVRDPDGVAFRAFEAFGPRDSTYVVDLVTMRIVFRAMDSTRALEWLDAHGADGAKL